jgi:hypothetical protein
MLNDSPFTYINNPVQDLGESYVIIDNDTTVRLTAKTENITAISQVVRYIDVTFNFEKMKSS